MSEEIKMLLSIDCWSCGTFMTLDERSENDGDCPRCSAEIDLELYLDKVFVGYAERDARIAELELLAAAISADCNDMANERNQFRAELAALKFELEVAKTDELSAAVWAATEMIKHELWDAQAEIVKCDARIAELELPYTKMCERMWELESERDQLRAELAEIKAQEPVSWEVYYSDDDSFNTITRDKALIEYYSKMAYTIKPLYAAQVAKQVVMPERMTVELAGAISLTESVNRAGAQYACNWYNRALDAVARLNAADQAEGDV